MGAKANSRTIGHNDALLTSHEQESGWREIFQVRENRTAASLLGPYLLVVVLVQIYPTLYSMWFLFTSETGKWNDLRNITKIFTDPIFWDSLAFSGKMALGVLPISIALGTGLALLVKGATHKALWISILIIPLMMADLVTGIVWRLMFHASLGVLNLPYFWLGRTPVVWLEDLRYVPWAMIITTTWKQMPLAFLLIYSGLQKIPAEIYESSELDGAGPWRRFWDMTVPFLRPMITIALVLVFSMSSRGTGTTTGLTAGGPGRATWNVPYWIYQTAFRKMMPHYATAGVLIMQFVSYLVTMAFALLWIGQERKSR